jgi:thiosulfate reductase cytochrome b subunit
MEHSAIECVCLHVCIYYICMFVLVSIEIRWEAISGPNGRFDSDMNLLETNSLCTTASLTTVFVIIHSYVMRLLRYHEYMGNYRHHVPRRVLGCKRL